MDQTLIKDIIFILTGIAVLLCGMKLMSTGLKKSIGKGIKKFFKRTQNNPIISMGIGAVVTAGIQASDATNAMVVGFINAGAMTLFQGLCIMLGAYIGTTITGVLASFSSLSISTYFLLFSFVGTVLMFLKNEKVKNIGEILCGLGFLFFGLAVMKSAFGNADITQFIQKLFSSINFGPLLFLIGVIIAAIIQSSSAVISIVIAMVGSGALGASSALYLALGATLGTVANTLLSSLGGNIQGKRAALTIFFLRTITSVVMLIILMIFEKYIVTGLTVFRIGNSDELPIAMFTVIYNVIFMPALIPFVNPAIKLFNRIVKDKASDELSKSIHFIDDKLLITPTVATMQVEKEIVNMYDLSFKNYLLSMDLFLLNDKTHNQEIIKLEDQVDYLNGRITDFLIKLSNKVDPSTEKAVGSYFHVINDIERIGDHAYNFYEMYQDMQSKELAFSNVALKEIKEFHDILIEMFKLTETIFVDKDFNYLEKLHELETKTDNMKTDMSTKHYDRIKANECVNELTPYYSSLVTELERVADHLTNIGYSIVNPLGDENKD